MRPMPPSSTEASRSRARSIEFWSVGSASIWSRRALLPRTLGTSLNAMLELRQRADYSSAEVALVDVERSLTEAEAFIAAVERLIRGQE